MQKKITFLGLIFFLKTTINATLEDIIYSAYNTSSIRHIIEKSLEPNNNENETKDEFFSVFTKQFKEINKFTENTIAYDISYLNALRIFYENQIRTAQEVIYLKDSYNTLFKKTVFENTKEQLMYQSLFMPKEICPNQYLMRSTRITLIKKLSESPIQLNQCSNILHEIKEIDQKIGVLNMNEFFEFAYTYKTDFIKKNYLVIALYDLIKDIGNNQHYLSPEIISLFLYFFAHKELLTSPIAIISRLLNLIISGKLLYINKLFESSHSQESIHTPLKFYQTASQYNISSIISPLKNLLHSPNAPKLYDEFTLIGIVHNAYNAPVINEYIDNKKAEDISFIYASFPHIKALLANDEEMKHNYQANPKGFQIVKYIAKAEFYTNFAFAGMFLYGIYEKIRDHNLLQVYRLSQFLRLIKEKIEKVHELMKLYKNLKSKDVSFDFPEYTLCNSVLNNKQNKKNYNNLIPINFNAWINLPFSLFFPSVLLKQYYEIVKDYFNIDFSKEHYIEECVPLNIINQFVYFMDGLATTAKIIATNKNYSIPIILPPQQNTKPFIKINNMWNPLQKNIILNSLSLGVDNNPNNIILVAPTGSGKTYLLRTILLSIYSANIGIVPAQGLEMVEIDNVFQNISHIYSFNRGFSKHMGENSFAQQMQNIIQSNPDKNYLILLDEFYSGTTESRIIDAVKEFFPSIIGDHTFIITTTHYKSVFDILSALNSFKSYFMHITELAKGIFKKHYTLEPLNNNASNWWLDNSEESIQKRIRYGESEKLNEKKLLDITIEKISHDIF